MRYKVIPKGKAKPAKTRGLNSRSSHYDEDGTWSLVENLTVFEEEIGSEFTGVLNADGDPIYRIHEKQKIGFDTGAEEEEYYYE